MRHEKPLIDLPRSRFRNGIGPVETTERFTLRQTLPDGSVIRNDGADHWRHRGVSWFGAPPAGWDRAQAVDEEFVLRFDEELDYS